MGLSKDQRAMLRLLAQREEGYEDIAALMGIGVDEVRARVKGALAELQEEQGTRPAPEPSAPPAGPVAPTPAPPAARPVAKEPTAPSAGGAAGLTAPEEASATAGGGGSPAATGPAGGAPTRSAPRVSLPKEPRRLIELVGGALVALLLILFATGAVDLGGGDDDSDADPTAASRSADPPPGNGAPAANAGFTQAVLEPTDGGDASGLARFGRVKKSVVLQVEAEGLEPTGPGESYTVWLYRSPKLVLRVGAVRVTDTGGIAAQFPIPDQLLGVVANRAFNQIDVSLTPDDAYRAEVARARQQKRLPTYTGTSVLRGEIAGPLVSGE